MRKRLNGADLGLIVVLASLGFALYPLLRPGLPSVADAAIHLFRTAEWVRVWQDGILYPRWAPNLAFGHGFPLFIFAPPLPYFIAGSLNLLGLSLETAIKALPIMGLVGMGLGMYLFVRDVLGPRAGVVAAVAFVYAPFQLRESYLYGGNYPQLLAIALFPWVLWTFRRTVISSRIRDVLLAGLAYAALALCHNFHAFIFTPILAAYVLGLLIVRRPASTDRWTPLLRALGAGALGLALSACFWLPALYERQWTLAQEGFYVVRSNFQLRFLSFSELLAGPQLLDGRAANPYLPFALGWGILLLALLGLLALAGLKRLSSQERYHLAFFTSLLGLAVFMMLPASSFLWETVPFLATAEFPWRFMGLATLSLGVLAGGGFLLLEHLFAHSETDTDRHGLSLSSVRTHLPTVFLCTAVLLLILSAAVYTYPPHPFTAYGTPTLADSVHYEVSTQTIGTTTLGEYLPLWVKERPLTSSMVKDYLASRPVDKLDRSQLPPQTTARLVEHAAARDAYQVSSPRAWTLRLNTFYYPGWAASIDGQPADFSIDEPRGLIAVPMPPGEHTVAVYFENTPVRTVANGVSVAALLAVLGAAVYAGMSRRARSSGTPLALQDGSRPANGPDNGSARASGLMPAQALILIAILVLLAAARGALIDPLTSWFRLYSPPGQALAAGHPTRIIFDNKVALLGYDLEKETAQQGDTVRVRLYWQALEPVGADYSTFVHLDQLPALTTRAQSDNVHPGDARAQIDVPVRNWTAETYVRDEHTLPVPADIPPTAYALRVGLYSREGRRLPVVDENGRITGDAAFLQPLHVLSQNPPDTTGVSPAAYRLGDTIELTGVRINPISVRQGEPLQVHLFWKAQQTPSQDSTVFVHVLDEADKVIAQSDSQPAGGAYPTSWWWPGQTIEDVHTVPISGVAPGTYRLALGMYDPQSGQRLPITGAQGSPLPDSQIVLEQAIEVKP